MDSIRFEVKDGEIRAVLNQLQGKMGDLTPVMDEIGSALLARSKRTFETACAPDGTPWQALQPRTLTEKRAKRYSERPLMRSGTLASSINYQAGPASVVLGVARMGAAGSAGAYAAIHQFGGRTKAHVIRARNKKALFWPGAGHPVRQVNHPGSVIPARPYLFNPDGTFPEPWMRAIREILGDWLVGGAV